MILPGFFVDCDECGEPFEPNTRYPVLTVDANEGAMEIFSFCDEECLDTWRATTVGESGAETDGCETGA